MSQGITYADLRFTRPPLENSPRSLQEGATSALPGSGDGDLTYENIHTVKPQGEKAPDSSKQPEGPRKPVWPVALGLLGASLLLLATTLGFGVRYRQVSRRLGEASEASAAESRRLARSLDARERGLRQLRGRLEEAEAELNRSRAALRESGRLLNSTRGRLREQEARLAAATRQRLEAEEALNATRAEACDGWCPEEWLLYRGRCLFFSTQAKAWTQSETDCEWKAAQLLITQPGVPLAILRPLGSSEYWTGRYRRWPNKGSQWVWWESSQDTGTDRMYSSCVTLKNGQWTPTDCNKKHRYICEKPARPRGAGPLPVWLA